MENKLQLEIKCLQITYPVSIIPAINSKNSQDLVIYNYKSHAPIQTINLGKGILKVKTMMRHHYKLLKQSSVEWYYKTWRE